MAKLASIALFMFVTGCGDHLGVGGQKDSGAGSDSGSEEGTTCFGSAPYKMCLAASPTTPLTISHPYAIDRTIEIPTGGDYYVVAGTTISILSGGEILATGPKPLVLIASDSIVIGTNAYLDVSSALGRDIGAGGDFAGCPSGSPSGMHGGGAGGSFGGLGATGGKSGSGGNGGTPGAVATTTMLRGGCPGQDGNEDDFTVEHRGRGGHGGGVVLLIAGNSIEVNGVINASGAGGGGGADGAGGGGGGSGGMIVLDAPRISGSGLILANGGGGGEGGEVVSGTGEVGTSGTTPSTTSAASGGKGISPEGGDGGDGSTGGAGAPGANATGTGGGGGGGGGAGLILVRTGANGTNISPPPTVFTSTP